MISVEELADLLNSRINKKVMRAIQEFWMDGDIPFDPEHTEISEFLEEVCDKINERFEIEDFVDEIE